MAGYTQVPFVITSDTFPKVQDALSKPEKWNSGWETFYRTKSPFIDPFNSFQIALAENQKHSATKGHPGTISSQNMYDYTLLHSSTCEIQHRIGVKTIDALSGADFERRWVEGTDAVTRKKHALRALSNAGSLARNLNLARLYSLDILRVEYLGGDGQVLIDLLKAITPDDISVVPKEPYYFPEKTWDGLLAEKEGGSNEFEKYTVKEVLILRTKLIYLVVEGMMDSFLDKPLPTVLVQKVRNQRSPSERRGDNGQFWKEMKMMWGEQEGKGKGREELNAWKDRKSRRGIQCHNCQKEEKEGEKFSHCSKCWQDVQRDVRYCSKECQRQDWRIRHKAICGKSVDTVDEAVKASVPKTKLPAPTSRQIGPPVDGYKRSPLLVGHIRQLDMNPKIDFVLCIGPNTFVDIDCPYPPIQKLFRAARDKAMTTGDKETTAQLCHYTVWFLRAKWFDRERGFDFDAMIDRMEKEFEFPELRKAMLEMQSRQWADGQLRRPPLLQSLSPIEWITWLKMDKVDMERRL
ncbi:hypothetical protein VKT23_007860 [Stygiomarasmius scandens]|uniref:MYND-type domain-containing protein n=1 Tax=Marasmiellus scandens TaxID=2682957 RepID=A0ABR1JPS7_9AGAR